MSPSLAIGVFQVSLKTFVENAMWPNVIYWHYWHFIFAREYTSLLLIACKLAAVSFTPLTVHQLIASFMHCLFGYLGITVNDSEPCAQVTTHDPFTQDPRVLNSGYCLEGLSAMAPRLKRTNNAATDSKEIDIEYQLLLWGGIGIEYCFIQLGIYLCLWAVSLSTRKGPKYYKKTTCGYVKCSQMCMYMIFSNKCCFLQQDSGALVKYKGNEEQALVVATQPPAKKRKQPVKCVFCGGTSEDRC